MIIDWVAAKKHGGEHHKDLHMKGKTPQMWEATVKTEQTSNMATLGNVKKVSGVMRLSQSTWNVHNLRPQGQVA